VSDDLRLKMLKPRNLKDGVWKENLRRKEKPHWNPTFSFLMEKYTRQHRGCVFSRLGGTSARGYLPQSGMGGSQEYHHGKQQGFAMGHGGP
jgi:hypothetical protein